jgi:hypothetical protein
MPKRPYFIPKAHELFQTAHIFHSKTLQNIPKLVFLVRKYTIRQTLLVEKIEKQEEFLRTFLFEENFSQKTSNSKIEKIIF